MLWPYFFFFYFPLLLVFGSSLLEKANTGIHPLQQVYTFKNMFLKFTLISELKGKNTKRGWTLKSIELWTDSLLVFICGFLTKIKWDITAELSFEDTSHNLKMLYFKCWCWFYIFLFSLLSNHLHTDSESINVFSYHMNTSLFI